MALAGNLFGVLFALTSALVWGAGDFTGGYATRKSNQYAALLLSALSGLVVVILAALVWREPFPSARGVLCAALGGTCGALGIAAFYKALSLGHTATVAPTAAVIGAALPVAVGAATIGAPSWLQLVGFGLALAGIWLVSAPPAKGARLSREGFVLTCLAGLGFGGFLVFLGLVDRGKIFTPLIIARSMTLGVGLLLVASQRLRLPSIAASRWAMLAGVLDAGGNLFYVLAKQYTRLDVAAVLSSFSPASTVILASLILREKVSRYQCLGVILCLGAIGLIST